MNRQDQVKEALKLLKPANRGECTKYLNDALDDLEKIKAENQLLHDIASKKSRDALEAYCSALRKARVNHDALPPGLQTILGILRTIDGGHSEVNFGTLINNCERVLAAPHTRSGKDYFKMNAAARAKNILDLLGIESPLTHNGKWPALAAILHGDAKSKDLFHHCGEYKDAQ